VKALRLLALFALGSCAAPAARPTAAPNRVEVRPHPQAPPSIRTLGVPEIDPSIFDGLARFRAMRSASFADWSPDGRGLLISTRFAATSQLHRVFEPGGRREQITFEAEPVGGAIAIPGSGAALYSLSSGGDENYQIFLLDLGDLSARRLTDGRSRNTGASASPDGRFVIYASNRRNGRDMDLVLQALPDGEPTLLVEAKGRSLGIVDWSPDSKRVLVRHYVSATESYLHLLDLADRTLRPVRIADAGTAAFGATAFDADGRTIYTCADLGGEWRRLTRIDPDTGRTEVLTGDLQVDIVGLDIHRPTRRLVFTTGRDVGTEAYLLDLNTGRRERIEAISGGQASAPRFSPDGRRLAFTWSTATQPGEAHTYELETGRLERWTFSETAGVDTSGFVEGERHEVTSFDGVKVPFFVWRPRGAEGKRPVIVQIHGGPEGQSRPGFNATFQMWLRRVGAAVISPNVRGSTGYGRTYSTLDNAEKREDSVRDIGAILDWIETQPDLDESRVAVYGGSYGGYMALACGVMYGTRIRAIVDIVGISHFATFLSRTSGYRQDLRRAEYGDERDPKMGEIFERISPLNHAEKITAALLVAHGENDPRVPVGEAEQLVRRVSAAGRPVWYVLADNEGHGFAKKENADFLAAVVVRFLEEHLAP
jgi:dipeptidyl aminopeptidase/acylaminoacyl peptidase